MDKFQSKLEGILMPIGSKIANNKYLKVLQKSFIAVMPLTIAGSIALIISYFPFIDYVVPADVLNEIDYYFLGCHVKCNIKHRCIILGWCYWLLLYKTRRT